MWDWGDLVTPRARQRSLYLHIGNFEVINQSFAMIVAIIECSNDTIVTVVVDEVRKQFVNICLLPL